MAEDETGSGMRWGGGRRAWGMRAVRGRAGPGGGKGGREREMRVAAKEVEGRGKSRPEGGTGQEQGNSRQTKPGRETKTEQQIKRDLSEVASRDGVRGVPGRPRGRRPEGVPGRLVAALRRLSGVTSDQQSVRRHEPSGGRSHGPGRVPIGVPRGAQRRDTERSPCAPEPAATPLSIPTASACAVPPGSLKARAGDRVPRPCFASTRWDTPLRARPPARRLRVRSQTRPIRSREDQPGARRLLGHRSSGRALRRMGVAACLASAMFVVGRHAGPPGGRAHGAPQGSGVGRHARGSSVLSGASRCRPALGRGRCGRWRGRGRGRDRDCGRSGDFLAVTRSPDTEPHQAPATTRAAAATAAATRVRNGEAPSHKGQFGERQSQGRPEALYSASTRLM